jgi:exodeoxyribonuclease-3
MKILSWNVAGIRATLKKGHLDFLASGEYDIVCFQETKAEESQVVMPEQLSATYPFRYWRSTDGTTQRKGLSGTAIWSKTGALENLEPPSIDAEGRVTALEFNDFIVVTVYTPNSQSPVSERHLYRVGVWDDHFLEYIQMLNKRKPTIVCGDLNVANEDIDVFAPDDWRNTCAGFLDPERANFKRIINNGWFDSFREKHPGEERCYTFWDQKQPYLRRCNRGWRIDYFLVPEIFRKKVRKAEILPTVMGSDHCPVILDFSFKRHLKIVTEYST